MDRFHWLDHALDSALCFTLTSCNDQNFRDTFMVNGRFAVNFRGGFPRKIVPCPGAGHGGYNDSSLVSTSVSKGIQRKQMLLTLNCATFNVKLAYVMLRAPLLQIAPPC